MMDENLIVGKDMSLKQVMERITYNRRGVAFVCENKKLIGLISDGDIRRAILSGSNLMTPVHKIMNTNPISTEKTDKKELKELCEKSKISAIPIVNSDNELIDVFFYQ